MNTSLRTLTACLLAALPGLAGASGFGLIESNADGQGAAYAGSGAVAENASTIFFNPAGMTLLPGRQVVASLHAIKYVDKFEGGSPDGGDAGGLALVPNFYYAMPISSKAWFGIGLNSPFGLKTEYDAGWVGQTYGIKSDMKTVNINPSIGWRVNDQLSLGIGFNAMYITAELTNYVNGVAGTAKIEGDDWGYGYNFGLLYEFDKDSRIGLSYRSKVKQKLQGDATFSGLASLNGPVTADIELPDSATLSLYKRVSPRWALLADASWTGWGTLQELRVVRTNGTTLTSTPEHWQDTMRYSVGAHYQWNEMTKLRMGLGYDESPVPNAQYRSVRVPDSDRTWIAFGVGYRLNKDDMLDVAYSHLFLKDAPIDAPAGSYNHNKVDILGVQYTHTF
jgi:long-chain fatty acid transport protein